MKMTWLLTLTLISISFSWAEAARKAKIVSPEVEIYSGPNFDSDVVGVVQEGQTYLVSDQVSGAFYKIKLKSGKVGYVPDYEVDVEGKGRIEPKDFDENMILDEAKEKKLKRKVKLKPKPEDEEDAFDKEYHGITVQLINYHEDTLGGVQVDDLVAVGYKNVSDLSWEVIGAFKTPKYYTSKIKGSAKGFNLWGDFGISNRMEVTTRTTIRYGGAFFAHYGQTRVETATRAYDLQDLTAGLLLEGGFLFKVSHSALDLSIKYFFDRNSYGGFGVSVLF
ncbi:MAG: hypothetical protein H7061_03705 [Bdellovibrionaceae bacterium]|nr:hypothetical protein [Bdellovibrio sp.]